MSWRMGWLWLLATLSLSLSMQAQAQTTVEYIHTDALGSVVAVTDAAGQVIERNDYEPYGTVIGQPNFGGVGFTGHVQDAATGLTYMQQRYYDPMCGCFLSVDPVAANPNTGASFNRYNYANNNPYKFTDPDGRQSRDNVNPPSTGIPFIDWLMTPSDARGSKSQMMKEQFASELSQPQSAKDVVRSVAIAMSAGTGAAGGVLRAEGLAGAAEAGAAEKAVGYVAKDGKVFTNTSHGLDRAIGDGGSRAGTKQAAIRDALQNPKSVKSGTSADGRPFEVHKGQDARVVVNPETQKIISVNPTNRNGVR